MAQRQAPSEKQITAKIGPRIIYIFVVMGLLIFLLIQYIHNQNRKAQFLRLQEQAAQSEEYHELQPRIEEDTTTSGDATTSGDTATSDLDAETTE